MKRLSSIYLKSITAMLLLLTLNSSCKKEELNSKELFAYIKSDGTDVRIGNISFIRTPVSITGSLETSFTAYLTREISADVSMTVTIEESNLAQYNKDHKTTHLLLPASNYKISGSTLNIKAGSIASTESLKIELINQDQLTEKNGYLLPISIKQVTSNDKGVKSSNNYRNVYVVVTSIYNNIDLSIKTSIDGTVIDRTNPAWKVVSASAPYAGTVDAPKTLDGSNTTQWFSAGANSFITLDMGASNIVKGFRLVPGYVYGASYNATSIEVQISTDNITWVSQGTYTASAVLSSSSAASPDNRNINFYRPVTCRYVKFINTVTPSGYGGFAEINAIK